MLDNTQIMKRKLYQEEIIETRPNPIRGKVDFQLVLIITPTKNYYLVREGHFDTEGILFEDLKKAQIELAALSTKRNKK